MNGMNGSGTATAVNGSATAGSSATAPSASTTSNKRTLPSSPDDSAMPTPLPVSSVGGLKDTDDFAFVSPSLGAGAADPSANKLPTLNAGSTGDDVDMPERKRLRRGPLPDSEVPSPALSATPTDTPSVTSPSGGTPAGVEGPQSQALRDHLAKFKVDSQPGSSASSTYGGETQSQPVVAPGWAKGVPTSVAGAETQATTLETETPSSPVGRPGGNLVRGVKPVILDSPTTSVIDIRSSPVQGSTSSTQATTAPASTSATFATTSPSPHPPSVSPINEAEYNKFVATVGGGFTPQQTRSAFSQAGGNTMNAISILVGAKKSASPVPGGPSTAMGGGGVGMPGMSPQMMGVNRPMMVSPQPGQLTQQQQQQMLLGMLPGQQLGSNSGPAQSSPGAVAPLGLPGQTQQQPRPLYPGGPVPQQPANSATPQHFYRAPGGPGAPPQSGPPLQPPPQLVLFAIPPQTPGGPQMYGVQGRPETRLSEAQARQITQQQQQAMALYQQQQALIRAQQQAQQQQTSPQPQPQAHARVLPGGRGGPAQPSIQQLQMLHSQAQAAFRRQLASSGQTNKFSTIPPPQQQALYSQWLSQSQQFRGLLGAKPATGQASPTAPTASFHNVQRSPTVVQQPQQRQPVASGSRVPAPLPQTQQTLLQRTLAALPQAGGGKKKKKRRANSDSEDGGDYSDGGSDGEYGGESPAVTARRELLAVEFFNTCPKEELCELAGCNPTQASLVVKLRPFSNPNDFRARTRKQKGVGNTMMETYLDVIAGMHEIDNVLTGCETIGNELGRIMRIWATGASTGGPAPPPAEGEADVGINLVAMSEEAVAAKSVDPVVKEAFKDYVHKQPEGVPDTITLKDYQMLGLNWLNLLYRRGTSCILADDMGLGKTAQVISLIAHLKATGEPGPHLIIVPSSTLENWIREFSVFAPDLHVQSYYGSQFDRAELRHAIREMDDLDVVVTTYNIATSSADDQKFLKRKMDFKIAVFDEGHQLKNSESKKYKDLMQIRAKWRLLLTGTPLQNNLQELVSLLSFILPDQFRDAGDSLKAIFKVGPGSQANLLSTERISRAKKMMTPFVLRRKKVQVLKDLPNKDERIELCDMTDLQREVYNEAITRSKSALMEVKGENDLESLLGDDLPDAAGTTKQGPRVASTKTGNKSDKSSSSNVLMDLRKASNHPMLFRRLYTDAMLKKMAKDCLKEEEFTDRDAGFIYEDMEVMTDFELHRFCLPYKHLQKYVLKNDEWMSAGKIKKLQELLPTLKANGDRVLLFSQFTQVLDILEVVLGTMDMRYLKLTGQTSVTERQGLVDQYTNDPDITVFLLSTRAGGLGLNLTAANHVIFYDLDYNPHNDKQAEDRSFRIGQTRDVHIIRLITKDSLDEDMLALADTKLQLDASVSGAAPTTSEGGTEVKTGQVEKKMRTSLLSNLKKKFDVEQQATQGGHSSPVKEKANEAKVDVKKQ